MQNPEKEQRRKSVNAQIKGEPEDEDSMQGANENDAAKADKSEAQQPEGKLTWADLNSQAKEND